MSFFFILWHKQIPSENKFYDGMNHWPLPLVLNILCNTQSKKMMYVQCVLYLLKEHYDCHVHQCLGWHSGEGARDCNTQGVLVCIFLCFCGTSDWLYCSLQFEETKEGNMVLMLSVNVCMWFILIINVIITFNIIILYFFNISVYV